MSEGGQQQQQDAPKFDIGEVVGSLSQDNRNIMERKGWLKDGKPTDGFKLDSVMDNYRLLETKIGVKTLEEPNLADPEAFDKWSGHKLLGVPDKAEDYKFERPALPEGLKWSEADGDGGVPWDSAGEKMLRAALLKGKVGQAQADKIMKEIVQERIGGIVASRAARTNEQTMVTANLQKDFGAGLKGALESGKQAMTFIAEKAGIKDGAGAIDAIAAALGNETAVRFSIQLGKMLGEDTLKGGTTAGFATSPDAAKSQIDAFQADGEKVKALLDKTNLRHKSVNEEWQRLNKLARPES